MVPPLYKTPLHYKPLMGDDPRSWIEKRMKAENRRRDRQIGKRCLPFGIYDIMRRTVGFADPLEIRNEKDLSEIDKLYSEEKLILDSLLNKPLVCQPKLKQEERFVGAMKSREFTVYEFLARKRLTKSMIKLIKKVISRIRIILLIDHEETKAKEKAYFEERLDTTKKQILEEMEKRLPNVNNYIKEAVIKERTMYAAETKIMLEKEVELVGKMKENYLNEAYDFQMKWILKNIIDNYKTNMNDYSLQWNLLLEELKNKTENKIKSLQGSLELEECDIFRELANEIDKIWQKNINKMNKDVKKNLNKVYKQIERYDRSIVKEKEKINKLYEMIKRSCSIVERIILEFEKIIVYAYEGKPGECNYFLSYIKLHEIYKSLIQNVSEVAVSHEPSIIEEDEGEVSQDELRFEISTDKASLDVNIFKNCRDDEKTERFRRNILKMTELVTDARCLLFKKEIESEGKSLVNLKKIDNCSIYWGENSQYICERLTDAYRLLENILLGPINRHEECADEVIPRKIEQSRTNRLGNIISCFKRHPHLMRSFTGA